MEEKNNNRLVGRDELPEEYKWRIEDLYSSEEEWEKDYIRVRSLIPELEKYRGKLGSSGEELLACLELKDRMDQILEKVYVYAFMRKDEDNTNHFYQGLKDRAQGLNVQVGSSSSFIVPEILAIPEKELSEFKKTKGLELYEHYLDELTRVKEHILSPEEEQIIALSGEIGQAPKNIFGMLNNADLKFPSVKDDKGQEVEITHGRYSQLMESKDREVRKNTFKLFYGTYAKQKNTLAAILSSSIKKDIFYARIRKYDSALEAALDLDNIPREVYDNLIGAVRSRLDLMHRYVKLRKKVLGVDQLHMYDIYAPLVKDLDLKFSYSQAIEMVEKAMEPLGNDYLANLKKGLGSGWVDVYENKGKTSGAYSWGAYGNHPYVLLNYQDNLDNVFTLAHEMGHALHSYYTWSTQPYIYGGYTIFVAEVASTLNEILLTNHLLRTTEDKRVKLNIINHYLEQFRGTVYRQTMFAEFEKITHEKAEADEPLTPDLFCTIYRKLNEDYYGPDLVIDDEIELEWARIPHFYNAFYVYKYATGFSAASALAKGILEEGQSAADRYLQFLKGGSSDYSIELLRKAGVDMATPKPVEMALKVFEDFLTQAELLFAELD
jgi:oligoendopeptidase F